MSKLIKIHKIISQLVISWISLFPCLGKLNLDYMQPGFSQEPKEMVLPMGMVTNECDAASAVAILTVLMNGIVGCEFYACMMVSI